MGACSSLADSSFPVSEGLVLKVPLQPLDDWLCPWPDKQSLIHHSLDMRGASVLLRRAGCLGILAGTRCSFVIQGGSVYCVCRNLLAAFLLLVFAIYSAWLDEVLFYLHICLLFSSTPNVPVGKVKLKKRPKWKAST